MFRAAILGSTIGNDVTASDQIALDEMAQSKSGDGFTPLAPWIATSAVPMTVRVTARSRRRRPPGTSPSSWST